MSLPVVAHETPTPGSHTEFDPHEETDRNTKNARLTAAASNYAIQWFTYLTVAAFLVYWGSSIGISFSESAEEVVSDGLRLPLLNDILSIPPDQAFMSLAVLVVVVLTLSAGFRDNGIQIDPEAAYVRYRVQAWLLALTGIACNAIALMLLAHTFQNLNSNVTTLQPALVPLGVFTSIAVSLLSVDRVRQTRLETMMQERGLARLERQHSVASTKWEGRWGPIIGEAPKLPSFGWALFSYYCAVTYLQLLILTIVSILGNGNSLPLLLAPLSVAYFWMFPTIAFMSIVTNIYRGMDLVDRLSKIFISAIYLLLVILTAFSMVADNQWRIYLPHLALPAIAGIAYIIPLLLVSFRGDPRRHPNNAFFAPLRYQRAAELRAELRRRDMIEKRLEELRSDRNSRTSSTADPAD